jgi:DNA-binding LacI/PurR family transcriptional regulator
MSHSDVAKHQQVREGLIAAIRNGEYSPGAKLPAERDLAERYGVSYMTARRAVSDMVEADLLERRPREGTFVRPHTARRLATVTVHLICPAHDNAVSRQFLRYGARLVEEKGWRVHALRWQSEELRAGVRALENGDLALVLSGGPELQGPFGETLQKAAGRAVLIGNRLDGVGVPSVLADDAQAIRLAVSHLKSRGHEKIALVSDHPDHAVDRVQIAAWRACFGDEAPKDLERRLIAVNTPRYDSQPEYAYKAVRRYLTGNRADATALICLSDEIALAALAACRDAGRDVPGNLSLIATGDSPLMAFAQPAVTCIDVRMEAHIRCALQLLESALNGSLDPYDRLRFIEPRLVERNSTGPN